MDTRFVDRLLKSLAMVAGVLAVYGPAFAQLEPADAARSQVCSLLGCGDLCAESCVAFPASGQTTSYTAERNDGIPAAVPVPDDGAVQAGAELRHRDNGDGTISDLNTGLMWEKKSDDGGLHDQDNAYFWDNGCCGDGSEETIWDWLDDVNGEAGEGFAGHADWRIPNMKELQSIGDSEASAPAVARAFNTCCTPGCSNLTCSCAPSVSTWSSTSSAHGPLDAAWALTADGSGGGYGKTDPYRVRAVRGGSR
jgi:uncharacterized protein DUF1566